MINSCSRKKFKVIVIGLFVSIFFSVGTAAHSKSGARLNVLLITADDLGKQLSCYGDDIIETPNIDKLAKSGVLFENAYVTQASCSSSRSSILTGTYPHINGQIGLAHRGFQMNRAYPNLPAILKDEGYQTGIIGKLHVQPENIFPFDFDFKNYKEARDVELVAKRTEEFIKSSGDKPFFLYLNYSDPHVPFYREFEGHPLSPVNADDVHAFRFQGVDCERELQRIADFYSCIRRLDEGIGLVMDRLNKLGVLENTLIFFVGDHGAPFARGKAACYEASVGIPFLVSCPNSIGSGRTSDELVSTIDILPTVLKAIDRKIPGIVQGKSLWRHLHNKQSIVRDYLFTEYTYHVNDLYCFYPRRAIRDDRYKLILNLSGEQINNQLINIDGDSAYFYSRAELYNGTWVRDIFDRLGNPPEIEFYDLLADPFEKNNLSGNPFLKMKEEKLLDELYKWMKKTGDRYRKEDFVTREIEKLKTQKTKSINFEDEKL